MPRPFVILGNQRSMSTLLVQLLNQHPDVVCHSELFLPDRFFLCARVELAPQLEALGLESQEDVASRDADPIDFLRRVRALSGPEVQWVGHKLLRGNGPQVHAAELADPEVVKLVLVRNPAYAVTSKLIAQLTGDWTRSHDQPARRNRRIHVDPMRFLLATLANEHYLDVVLDHLRAERQRHLVIFGEDVPTQEGINDVFGFLDLDPIDIDLRYTLQRQNSTSLDDRVENLDQLRRYLDGTCFAEALDEDRVHDRQRWLGSRSDDSGRAALDSRMKTLESISELEWRLKGRLDEDQSETLGSRLRKLFGRSS